MTTVKSLKLTLMRIRIKAMETPVNPKLEAMRFQLTAMGVQKILELGVRSPSTQMDQVARKIVVALKTTVKSLKLTPMSIQIRAKDIPVSLELEAMRFQLTAMEIPISLELEAKKFQLTAME